jgi:uncharacterized membrane protein YqjE
MAGAERAAGARAGGLMSSLKQLVTTVVAIAETRLELLADELQVERQRIVQMIVLGAGALFFTACGILLLTLLVIVALWDSNRLLAIGAFALLYIALGCGLAVLARQTAAGSRLFAASLGELRKDRARLSA